MSRPDRPAPPRKLSRYGPDPAGTSTSAHLCPCRWVGGAFDQDPPH